MSYLLLDTVTAAAILFIVSSGLLIIFGVMKIINFAHASFLAVGGYTSFVIFKLGLTAWWSFPIAFILGCVVGVVVERVVLRYLYSRPLDAILATWGLGIVIVQLITVGFGRATQFVNIPVTGAIHLIGANYSTYRIVLVLFAIVLAVVIGWLLKGTRIGLNTRAVIMNEHLARGLGLKTKRVRIITFSFGLGLACLAGALISPISSVDPNLGFSWLVSAFMLVLLSGESLVALIVMCLILGAAQVATSTYVNPVLGGLVIPVVAALLLRLKPEGFAHG
ncbi:MAG: branched-chain amino acid ABC transporter permease [Candidimonas sp.]|nr:MAG: branched-chain amino acid ABC transporter permease [Candidimonas sp.]